MTEFASILLKWYDLNKRDLPWRLTKDPYKVWISEIILQQTQVVQGTAYYMRFVEYLPDIQSLANASEDEVLKMWEGLGYYSRARNLHATAKLVVANYRGIFPTSYEEIIQLKGVGPYTAAAIASICFNLPYAAIDGNVYRFLSRYFGFETAIDTTKGKKDFKYLADKLLYKDKPSEYNQAIMEMGATVCKPKLPLCDECPFSPSCIALRKDLVAILPIKEKKIKQRSRYFHFLFVERNGSIAIERRNENDIWKGLYQLPLVEMPHKITDEKLSEHIGLKVNFISEKKHILSHQVLFAKFYSVHGDNLKLVHRDQLLYVPINDVRTFAFPQLIVDFFNERIYLKGE